MSKPVRMAKGVYRVDVPLYHYTTIIAFNWDNLVKQTPGVDLSNITGYGAFCLDTIDDDGVDGLLMFFEDACPEYIAHEAVHAGHFCLLSRCIEVDMNNDEALAYLVGWYAKTVTELAIKEGVYNANAS